MALGGSPVTYWDKWAIFWIATNFYIHFGWESDPQLKDGWSPFNLFVQAFDVYGKYDRRYRLTPSTEYGSSIDKAVLAVEVPAGIVDGTLCVFWLNGILNNTWYRNPVQLVVSALHAFGTLVFWGDEVFPGYMSWFKGKGFKWTNTDGPKSIHWWWAFIGLNAVWVVVPLLYCRSALDAMKPALQAAIKN
ncbi:unnamed protein product [Polarella glacialis]|uniref:EXPERA domain-containing protein n=1 Tax=Polarella glacialis TaxID=89957 RepID=A0A813IGG9_POLGL|nr:unnamed protein product [Polarella glacialis]